MPHDPLRIIRASLGSFERRQSYAPGMFEPLTPLFRSLGYDSAAVYLSDNFPDRMLLACVHGPEGRFPPVIPLARARTFHDEMRAVTAGLPGVMVERLFSHGRELGAIAATLPGGLTQEAGEAFRVLARSVSIMAYVECIRTNSRRERQERDIFFAQSLTSRLLIRKAPKVPGLRVGFEFVRDLEAGGDFFDLFPAHGGGLTGFIGCCSGKGLRTVLDVCGIMRLVHRELHGHKDREGLADVLRAVNTYLVKEKRRARQASLCLFHADPASRRLRLAAAGRLGLALTSPGGGTEDVSSRGGPFLGIADAVAASDAEFEFLPGYGFLAVTEGGLDPASGPGESARGPRFPGALSAALSRQGRRPLANALFSAGQEGESTPPGAPLLAVSVEFTGARSGSVRRGGEGRD